MLNLEWRNTSEWAYQSGSRGITLMQSNASDARHHKRLLTLCVAPEEDTDITLWVYMCVRVFVMRCICCCNWNRWLWTLQAPGSPPHTALQDTISEVMDAGFSSSVCTDWGCIRNESKLEARHTLRWSAANSISACLHEINAWMTSNFLNYTKQIYFWLVLLNLHPVSVCTILILLVSHQSLCIISILPSLSLLRTHHLSFMPAVMFIGLTIVNDLECVERCYRK